MTPRHPLTYTYSALALLLAYATPVLAQADPETADVEYDSATLAEFQAYYEAYVDSTLATFDVRAGTVELPGGVATVDVPEGYGYIPPANAHTLLEDIWGNPEAETLGMLLASETPTNADLDYAVDITFVADGYVDDEDARDLDYGELLGQMQEGTEAENEAREAQGYPAIHLVGWAAQPYYDAERKRLHFAKELAFADDDGGNTLNYNVQFLNRRGYLNYNVIGGMDAVPRVNAKLDELLASATFPEGERYADFDSTTDEVAAYGVAGLIAGGLLSKAGFFAKIGLFLAKGWKIVAVAVIAGIGAVRKLFGGKDEEPTKVA